MVLFVAVQGAVGPPFVTLTQISGSGLFKEGCMHDACFSIIAPYPRISLTVAAALTGGQLHIEHVLPYMLRTAEVGAAA